MLDSLPLTFVNAKVSLIAITGLSRDALHIYVALGLFLAVKLLWRGRGSTVFALLLIAAGTLTGEWLDHGFELLRKQQCDTAAHWHDIWNTLFWPVVLAIVLPWLAPRRGDEVERAGEDAPPEPSGEDAVPEPSGEDAQRRFEQT
ncbi:hypothetical protein [Sphingopyxis sp.]|uniref:hypothetical protein n=1 Tax=Sphingopyxis sp. TaxID=1908224 RepID=UPI003D80FDF3